MSLDVWLLVGEERIEDCSHCEGTGKVNRGREQTFEWNITHNLTEMADKAGIYQHLWRPDEIGITKAGDLIKPLREGLARLRSSPEYFKDFNPDNGWGSYEGLVNFVQAYIEACEDHPHAEIRISR